MANMTISVNDNIKRDFTRFCDDVGLTASAVLNVCMVTISRERRIPFTIQAPLHTADDIAALESDIAISRREFEEGKGVPLDEVSRNMLAAINEHAAPPASTRSGPASHS